MFAILPNTKLFPLNSFRGSLRTSCASCTECHLPGQELVHCQNIRPLEGGQAPRSESELVASGLCWQAAGRCRPKGQLDRWSSCGLLTGNRASRAGGWEETFW
ncbi:mCG147289 [Mus musculus]|uniref:Uncharacterized protein n=1 Tax=Mus musculus TaxID=10090 RepID=Q8C5C2_MOUSE|nr:mCG147289 [Mus musculus]BAC37466.1 unnamed protein product [Mus musculus]